MHISCDLVCSLKPLAGHCGIQEAGVDGPWSWSKGLSLRSYVNFAANMGQCQYFRSEFFLTMFISWLSLWGLWLWYVPMLFMPDTCHPAEQILFVPYICNTKRKTVCIIYYSILTLASAIISTVSFSTILLFGYRDWLGNGIICLALNTMTVSGFISWSSRAGRHIPGFQSDWFATWLVFGWSVWFLHAQNLFYF